MSDTLIKPGLLPMWDEAMSASGDSRGHRGKPDWTDILFFLVLAAGAAYAMLPFGTGMSYNGKRILVGAVLAFSWLAWLWRPIRPRMLASGAPALCSIWAHIHGRGGWPGVFL